LYARARIGDRGIIGYQIGGQNRGPKQAQNGSKMGVHLEGSKMGSKMGCQSEGSKIRSILTPPKSADFGVSRISAVIDAVIHVVTYT
jgi:hypothetical protein